MNVCDCVLIENVFGKTNPVLNLLFQEKNRITKDGFLIVSCEKTRKQYLNQAECLDKIRCFIRNAEKPPYEPSEEEIMTMNKRLVSRNP